MSRIEPVRPPYDGDVAARLDLMMPPGVPPIGLFRTFVRNLPMATAIGGWGGYQLSTRLSLTLRDRETVIDRTCAICRCEKEMGRPHRLLRRASRLHERPDRIHHPWSSDRPLLDR